MYGLHFRQSIYQTTIFKKYHAPKIKLVIDFKLLNTNMTMKNLKLTMMGESRQLHRYVLVNVHIFSTTLCLQFIQFLLNLSQSSDFMVIFVLSTSKSVLAIFISEVNCMLPSVWGLFAQFLCIPFQLEPNISVKQAVFRKGKLRSKKHYLATSKLKVNNKDCREIVKLEGVERVLCSICQEGGGWWSSGPVGPKEKVMGLRQEAWIGRNSVWEEVG